MTAQGDWHHGITASVLRCWSAPRAAIAEGFSLCQSRQTTGLSNRWEMAGEVQKAPSQNIWKSPSAQNAKTSNCSLEAGAKGNRFLPLNWALAFFCRVLATSLLFSFASLEVTRSTCGWNNPGRIVAQWQPCNAEHLHGVRGASSSTGCLGRTEGNCFQPCLVVPPGISLVGRKPPSQASPSNADLIRSRNKPLYIHTLQVTFGTFQILHLSVWRNSWTNSVHRNFSNNV